MTDERFEPGETAGDGMSEFVAAVKRAMEELDPVPLPPREQMWKHIQEQRRHSIPVAAKATPWRRVASWGIGLAAMLAIGVGIGRFSARSHEQVAVAPSTATAPVQVNRTAYRLAVGDHLARAEALLTSFRTQPRGALDPQSAAWAQDLLTNTRLLLDSPAADDPKVAALLEDLELIIAQIVRMPKPSVEESEIIREGINKTAVLPRLRATLPAGPASAGT